MFPPRNFGLWVSRVIWDGVVVIYLVINGQVDPRTLEDLGRTGVVSVKSPGSCVWHMFEIRCRFVKCVFIWSISKVIISII